MNFPQAPGLPNPRTDGRGIALSIARRCDNPSVGEAGVGEYGVSARVLSSASFFDLGRKSSYVFQWHHDVHRGTQAEFPDKGKPVVRLGRKAMGLGCEIARLPKGRSFYQFFSRGLAASQCLPGPTWYA